jgi:hypothetical protein
MKAKIQIGIGLSTALAISVVLIIHIACGYRGGKSRFIYHSIFLLALLGAYSLALILKRTKTLWLILLIWCTVWILCYLTLVLYADSVLNGYGPSISILDGLGPSIFILGGWPALVLHDFFGWGEDFLSVAFIAPVGFWSVTFLMWTGIRGMGQPTRTMNKATEKGENR